ncbi:FecR family protein [Plebeiibacterium marinum]|uniref:FecR family protein n=1 Tax=Plebeiibacterium marinum TaxID=2992111 RepID=A0AAE3MFE1_9BACT|nr:FecR family protein [Plebeiobacterium marinum]MCW3806577.1 FecR family protein [Plebeiobacterium marinum]
MKKFNKNIDWNLAGKVISGEASSREQIEFDLWLNKDNNINEWNKLLSEVEQAEYALTSESIDIERAWKSVRNKTTSKTIQTHKRYYLVAVAASIIILIGIFLFIDWHRTPQHLFTFSTQNLVEQVNLKDGSSVDLNRHSSISLPESFNTNKRTLELQGEAFFDIKRNEKIPFVIHTKHITIKVLGTSFNVKDYPNSDYSEVIVKTGIVEVIAHNDSLNKTLLNAGDKAIYNRETNQLTKTENKNINYLSWKTKDISFKKDKMTDAIKLLEEVYNVEISGTEELNPENEISATFEKNTIEHILSTINKSHSLNLEYKIKE